MEMKAILEVSNIVIVFVMLLMTLIHFLIMILGINLLKIVFISVWIGCAHHIMKDYTKC